MARKLLLNVDDIVSWLSDTILIPAINKTLESGKVYAEKVSPEDTTEYRKSFKVGKAKLIGADIVWELENTDTKATGVEYWWRKTVSKWSKQWWSPIVEFWVGARVFQKTIEIMRKDFTNNVPRW